MNLKQQARALGGEDLPACLAVAGRSFRLVHTYKHAFVSAVGLYRNGSDRLVLKCYRRSPLLGMPLSWTGRVMAGYETYVLWRLRDLPGVPRLVGRYGATGIVRQYIPGDPLRRNSRVNEEFFPRLYELLQEVHARGIACIDLEKPRNILLGSDGRPYLIDFQLAFCWPEKFLGRTWPLEAVRQMLQMSDMYHLGKHWRRLRPDQLSRRQIERSYHKPWAVRLGNAVFLPVKKLRRLLFGTR